MSYGNGMHAVTVTPLRCKSVAVGPETGIYLGAKCNIVMGHRAGFNTRTSNNILIGTDINGGGNEIKMGRKLHKTVNIGAYDLQKMFEHIQKLQEKVVELEDLLSRPNGPYYNKAKEQWETKLKDADTSEK
jgi:hypothetical protein